MNINIGYAVILASHIFHPRGQTKVAYIKMCYEATFSNNLYFDICFKELDQTLCVQYKHIIHNITNHIFKTFT